MQSLGGVGSLTMSGVLQRQWDAAKLYILLGSQPGYSMSERRYVMHVHVQKVNQIGLAGQNHDALLRAMSNCLPCTSTLFPGVCQHSPQTTTMDAGESDVQHDSVVHPT